MLPGIRGPRLGFVLAGLLHGQSRSLWMKTSEMVKTTTPMIDPFGRHITYLRVSVTDRCDFRCIYCMTENMTFLPKKDLLTLEEIDRLASAFISRGVRSCLEVTLSMMSLKLIWGKTASTCT